MKNYIQPGKTLNLVVGASVPSGSVVEVGAFIGVTQTATAATGTTRADVLLEGVVELSKKAATALTEGQLAYWDDSNSEVTDLPAAGANILLGAASEAAGASDALCRVRLNGTAK